MPSAKQFDEQEALERALAAFWEGGYEATSMSKLLERMGIQKGSFYATFTSKRQIYLDAMRQYADKRFGQFLDELRGLAPREAIAKMFETVRRECGSKDGSRGCFVINCALEKAPMDDEIGGLVRDSLARHEKILKGLLEQGVEDGDFRADLDIRSTAKSLLGLIIAMRVYSRAGMPSSYPGDLCRQALAMLD